MSDTTLKERFFQQDFWNALELNLRRILPKFNGKQFQQAAMAAPWHDLELKARIRRVAVLLRPQLAPAYSKALAQLVDMAEQMLAEQSDGFPFAFLFLADFVEEFGLEDWEASLAAMPVITQVMSCEFAVRPFLLQRPAETLAAMREWAEHPNHHVRRLASEGCRPMLPWGAAIPSLKRDPSPILPILTRLKADPSEYVRRSVANNLNDISKNQPDLVKQLAKEWLGANAETDKLLKHALRTLLKKGDAAALALFGFEESVPAEVRALRCQSEVRIGEDWEFSAELMVLGNAPQTLRLEFGIDYQKANGSLSRKVFQLKESAFAPGVHRIVKRHSFQERTTRRHHVGKHGVALLVNGQELGYAAFEVTPAARP